MKERSDLLDKDIFIQFWWHRIECFIFSFSLVAALSLFFGYVFFHIRTVSAQNKIIYVDVDATGDNDGSSWENAFTDLQSALDVASVGQEIWVAEGVYYPTREVDFDRSGGSDPQEATFQIPSGVGVYGNFAGTETQRSQRDWSSHFTVLSGDIDQDDDILPGRGNAYHVVYFDSVSSRTVLDGFSIRGGNADGSYPHERGAGIYNDGRYDQSGSNPTISNCVIHANNAGGFGGGMFNDGHQGVSNPTIRGSVISGNSAAMAGGGVYNSGWGYGTSNPMFVYVTLRGNSTGGDGAGIFNDGSQKGESNPKFFNCFIEENEADGDGSGVFNSGWDDGASNPILANCVISANRAGWFGGGMVNDGRDGGESSPRILNVTISGNMAGSAGGGIFNIGVDGTSEPEIRNTILWHDRVGASINEITNDEASPSLSFSNIQNSSVDVDGDDDVWNDELGQDDGHNIDVDPAFVAPVHFTAEEILAGDLYLQQHSPCIDAGHHQFLPDDVADLDFDANLTEPIPLDLDGEGRIQRVVDMGAYEDGTSAIAAALSGGMNTVVQVGLSGGPIKVEGFKVIVPPGILPDGSSVLVRELNASNAFDRLVDIKIKGPDGKFIADFDQSLKICIQPTGTALQKVDNRWNLLTIFHQRAFNRWVALDTTPQGSYVCTQVSSLSQFGLGGPDKLPETGFAPGSHSTFPSRSVTSYRQEHDIWLQIPTLGVEAAIVGVPLTSQGWDIRWLDDRAGYLHGTAFPTWAGNTVITAHVWNYDNQPGPFVGLHSLRKGDEIILHAWNLRHVYRVRSLSQVRPDNFQILEHENQDVLTLITCRGYDRTDESYLWRFVVRAVLDYVEAEK